ncbi:cyclase family protein [Paenalcaligenes sp. Me131]|uniref:cyclase family protein n=1 Tax=Paenalcaligenes sp. Me131 TaxID=3392636 RepID=UPI003D27AE6D
MSTQNSISQLVQALNSQQVKVIDLTHTLSESFPALQLPPEFGQTAGFSKQTISQYNEQGPAWYWNNFTCGEHTGTHFDAPVHWVSGKDQPQNTVDTIPAQNFIRPAVVIDASAEVAANEDWVLTSDFLKAWEATHGRIPEHSWVFLRTDWSKRLAKDPASYVNMKDDGPHTPGPSQEAVEWMLKERNVHGFGVETINTDAGQSYAWPMPFPCHTLMHGANRYGLQCMQNLDQLPPTGALIISAPLKIEAGSGSPLRVLALVSN